MVCEVQQGNGLFKYNKEMVCVSTARRWFVKYSKEEMVCVCTARRWFVKYSKQMVCEVTTISWCCEVQQGDGL